MRAGGKAKRPRAESFIAEQHLHPPCHDFFCLSLPVFLLLNRVGAEFHASFGETSLALKDRGWMQGGIKVRGSSHRSLAWKCYGQLVPRSAGALGMQS